MRKCNRVAKQYVRIALFVISLAGEGVAQSSSVAASNPLSRDRGDGWQLYNVTTSFGYSTLALPSGIQAGAGLGRLESDYDGTASASFGYNYSGGKTSVSMLYAPSVVGRVRYSQLNALNQSLSLSASRKLGYRWEASLSFGAADSTLDQLLFTPAILSTATAPVATMDDLLGAVRGGQYTSDQLASILTGTPYVVTPSRSIVFGSKFLSTSLSTGLKHRYSPRLSFTLGIGANRSQTRNNSQEDLQSLQNFVIPRTTSEQANISANYALSPRTEIGVRGSTNRIDSTFSRYIITSAEFLLSHKISPHWFTSVSGGPAQVTMLRTDPRFSGQVGSGGRGYTVQGSVGYTLGKTSALMGSYGKTKGDTFGFGAQNSESLAGSWQWVLPGRSWAFYASGGSQRITGGAFGDFQYYFTSTGFSRALSRQTAISFAFGYVDRHAGAGSTTSSQLPQDLRGFSTRVTLTWDPFGRGEMPGAGSVGANR